MFVTTYFDKFLDPYHRGCNIILRFGNGTVFYEERINHDKDKIVIDLGQGH